MITKTHVQCSISKCHFIIISQFVLEYQGFIAVSLYGQFDLISMLLLGTKCVHRTFLLIHFAIPCFLNFIYSVIHLVELFETSVITVNFNFLLRAILFTVKVKKFLKLNHPAKVYF